MKINIAGMKSFLIIFITVAAFNNALAQPAGVSDTAYWEVASQRAGKIVNSLALEDEVVADKVRERIAMQYYNLNMIQGERDRALEELKKNNSVSQEQIEVKEKKIRAESEARISKLHTEYLADLSQFLDTSQIDQVKDGMTYGVLLRTYNAYIALLPDLNDSQKDTIMNYLVKARDIAMDAGSAEEKHYWFGKYKGKINNYLSKEGYDLKEAEKNLKKDTDQ